ncbi:hypothetical protein BDE02_03G023100 [Populus trichocarpa]|nr:hypothetical protein BDE02_03G023100 [Populus trichocarpa]KAI5593579.1 hypothetical protein BDE02_03G023100 [Populus trichocarpa]
MKEKEKSKRLIKISRIAMRQLQVSHASFFVFFFIFSCVSHKKQTWGNIKCWEVIFVGTSCVIYSFDDDLLDGCMKLVSLSISRMETLKRHLLFSGEEGLQELKKIAIRFEEKIYTTATNQSDYLRKISLEILLMEIRSQNAMPTAPMDP